MIDIVITFVDGNDPVWQKSYAEAMNVPAIAKRYRDWGFLRFLLRGVETCMPFVGNVHLVVSGEEQVPAWVNRENVHVVLHRDIIPPEFLPVFNSTAIEIFLHRIPGLGEQFLYFNDDVIPLLPCRESDFYDGRIAKMGMSRHLLCLNQFKRQVRNSDRLARKSLGISGALTYLRPQHTCSPMFRSVSEEAFERGEADLLSRVHPLRTDEDVCQYYYLDYLYLSGRMIGRRISNKHFSMAAHSAGTVADYIDNPSCKLVCINDVEMSEEKFQSSRRLITDAFLRRFPNPSRYEK